ncbi:SusE domain-containing protein [Bizionia arctica]|uniref:SusE outer membrane protein domain-containing protein n=1 Tax=Bizionia arctica TaxID=1495645 RepID=A0A917GDP6_9FLAO|nr:SusE domain-containing protein [Bizionia arctica]GGG40025.1 hypothetical protein GCM10010976_09610 [Bizionia arctica]
MKNIYKILLGLAVILGFASCENNDDFGYKPTAASFQIETPETGTNIIIDDTNMNNVVLTIVWEDTDGENYTVEFAETSTLFAEPFIAGVTDENNMSWTAGELNTFLLETVRIGHSVESNVDVRVKNAAGEYSNVITLLVTPFIQTVEQLYVNASFNSFDPSTATAMTLVEYNVFSATVELTDTDDFNFIEDNITGETIWQEIATDSGLLTKFGGTNLSGYDSGIYKIDVDLVNFTVELTLIIQPKLAVPGNHQGWDPASAPLLAASSGLTADYEGYVWLDGEHKFLGPDADGNFDWGNPDWGDNGTFTGILVEDGEVNCTATAGYYFIQADTDALTYSETQTSWGLIGSGTGSWNDDQDMTYDAGSGTWSVTLDLTAEEIKFRANDEWELDYGDTDADGFLELGGTNITVPTAGNYTVTLDLSVARAYTYTLTLN